MKALQKSFLFGFLLALLVVASTYLSGGFGCNSETSNSEASKEPTEPSGGGEPLTTDQAAFISEELLSVITSSTVNAVTEVLALTGGDTGALASLNKSVTLGDVCREGLTGPVPCDNEAEGGSGFAAFDCRNVCPESHADNHGTISFNNCQIGPLLLDGSLNFGLDLQFGTRKACDALSCTDLLVKFDVIEPTLDDGCHAPDLHATLSNGTEVDLKLVIDEIGFWSCPMGKLTETTFSGGINRMLFTSEDGSQIFCQRGGVEFVCLPASRPNDDGVSEDLDSCPTTFNPHQVNIGDGDPAGDCCDNCPVTNNPDQADSDEDGIGDACEEGANICAPSVPCEVDADCQVTGAFCHTGCCKSGGVDPPPDSCGNGICDSGLAAECAEGPTFCLDDCAGGKCSGSVCFSSDDCKGKICGPDGICIPDGGCSSENPCIGGQICGASSICVNPSLPVCDNGVDDDGDGVADCDDNNCSTDPLCATP